MQEQVADSSGAPPDYEGRIALDPTLLDVERLVAALETGGFELSNTRVHQNLLLHHIGRSMARSAILLRELCSMAGRAYRPADLSEISWRDLQWVEIQRRSSPVRNMVFFELFLYCFSPLSMLFYPFPLFSLSFTPQEKTIRVLLIP